MPYVLKPLDLEELKKIFDEKSLEIITYLIKKCIYSQPELLPNQKELAIQIPKEYLEQICVQAIGAQPVGAGSYPVDITKDDWGADIKSLACRLDKNNNIGKYSGETSLAQKFKGTGKDLDNLFEKKEYKKIKDDWIEIVREKNKSVIEEKNLKKIYYFFILRGYDNFYLCGTELILDNLKNVKISSAHENTNSSLFLDNYIESTYGNTKIYKAKKRLELRLNPRNWIDNGLCIEISCPKPMSAVKLKDKDLNEYAIEARNLFFDK